MTTSSWLICASCDSRNSAFVSTLACGKAAIALSTAASPSSGRHALGELGGHEEVPRRRRRAGLVERVEGDQPVAGDRRVGVDAGDGQLITVPFWNVSSTGSPICRS